MIKISVIIAIYNMEEYLEECLNSVINQTLEDIEVICVDDGSTDRTPEILRKYKNIYHNIIVIEQKRQGAGAARNRAIEKAKGEFLAFIDSDDFYYDQYVLEKLYNTAKEKHVLACGGSLISSLEGKMKTIKNPSRQKTIFTDNSVVMFSDYQFCYGYTRFIFDRLLIAENRIKFPLYMRNEDPIFMARVLSASDQFATISDIVYVARVFDKKIKFENKRVITDVAKGFYDLMKFAYEKKYKQLQEVVLMELPKWKNKFWVHIYKGNVELLDILSEMDNYVLDCNDRCKDSYFLNGTKGKIFDYISEYLNYISDLKNNISQYENIIIYGAGQIGKTVFDFVESIESVQLIVFAVTNSNAMGTARGKQIHCINEFVDMIKGSLVLISGNEKNSLEMKKNAIDLGFKNIIVINKEILDVEHYEIKNGCFAI